MPTIGVDYFNRLFASEEQPGQRTKPQHWLFWSLDKGATQTERDLCTPEDWSRVQKLAR